MPVLEQSASEALVLEAPEIAWLSISELCGWIEGAQAGPERLERWLTPAERTTYHSFDLPKRRRDWLAGRIAAKDAIARRLGLKGRDAFESIEIVALQVGPRRGRPVYKLAGEPGSLCLSISHSGDVALVALGRAGGSTVGVDLDAIEPRDRSFESLALSTAEIRRLRGLDGEQRWRAVTRIWVLKEALSKALGTGLRLALPAVSVAVDPISGELEGPAPFRPMTAGGQTHPLLKDLKRCRVLAKTLDLGGLIGAWVVLSSPEEA